MFNESFFELLETLYLLGIDLPEHTPLTLDSGFDSEANKITIRGQGLVPVIYPNPRGIRSQEKIHELFETFEPYRHIYKERYRVERCFAWEDTYRKLVIRYERLHATHLGFKYLAFTMVNLRWFLGKSGRNSL